MTIKKFISKVRGVLLRRLEPLKYASKIGVNFPRGGGYTYMGKLLGVQNHGSSHSEITFT